MKTIARISTIGLIAILLLGGISACSDRDTRHGHVAHALDYMAFRLDFDEPQKAIVEKLKLEIADIRAENRQQRGEQLDEQLATAIELLNTNSLSQNAFQLELEQLLDVHKQRAEILWSSTLPRILPMVGELQSTLTDSQKAKLEKKLQQLRKKRHTG